MNWVSRGQITGAVKKVTPNKKHGGGGRHAPVTSAMLVRDRALAVWVGVCVLILLVAL